MSNSIEIRVPDIGGFKDVAVIDILVKSGDSVAKDASLVTVESDKAAMDIPCPQAGMVEKLLIKVGDKVSEGTPILVLAVENGESEVGKTPPVTTVAPTPHSPLPTPETDLHAQVLVLGAGPGGYTAAFRAADLGLNVVLVERFPSLGGVCLNVGCIPSKALLHTARLITEAEEMGEHGVGFAKPKVDLAKLREWKAKDVVGKLTGGLAQLAKQRKVTVVHGVARFTGPHSLEVAGDEGAKTISFDHAIIAAGSEAIKLPFQPDDPRVMSSTGALALADVPKRLLVIGGGIIGLEMGTVYDALGSKVTVVELGGQLIPGCDADLVRPLHKRMEKRFEAIKLNTGVTGMEAKKDGIHVTLKAGDIQTPRSSTGSWWPSAAAPTARPSAPKPPAWQWTSAASSRWTSRCAPTCPTSSPSATSSASPCWPTRRCTKARSRPRSSPAIKWNSRPWSSPPSPTPTRKWPGWASPRPKPRRKGMDIEKGAFPWAASGRALSIARTEGMTKLIMDKASGRVIGAGIVGINAGELLAEAVLAIEMGATAEDIGLTIHAHPTLSETVCFAAEMAEGTITDLLPPRKR
jgi:dihydrolipoamide dehydrogenase